MRALHPMLVVASLSAAAGLCAQGGAADTSRPPIPPALTYPRDTARLVREPGDTVVVYYRTLAFVYFDDSTSGPAIRAFFAKYGARIVGGENFARGYVVEFPDPGPNWEAYLTILGNMGSEPGVETVGPVTRRDALPEFKGRYPGDGGAASADTGRPRVPLTTDLPVDSPLTIRWPDDTATVYYRNVLQIVFHDSASGQTVRGVLARYGATIIGGAPYGGREGAAYIVQTPDPGLSVAALEELLSRLESEPGVVHVRVMMYRARFRVRSAN